MPYASLCEGKPDSCANELKFIDNYGPFIAAVIQLFMTFLVPFGLEALPAATAARVAATASAAEAVPLITRSLDNVASLRGATQAEVEGLIPPGWVKSATSANKGGLGVRFANPEKLGEQVRIMPGKATDPNPVKQGPYMRISRDGAVSDPIPLFGNPAL
jgi:hypothetical protein